MLQKIDHIGLVVADLEKAMEFYCDCLGLQFIGREVHGPEQIEVATFKVGESAVELIRPLSADSAAGRFLARHGEGMHHIAYRVEDVEAEAKALAKKGLSFVGEAPKEGVAGTKIAFLHPKSAFGVLMELVQQGNGEGH